MPAIYIKRMDTYKLVTDLLESVPEEAGPELVALWRLLKRMTIDRFSHFMRILVPDWQELQVDNTEVESWTQVKED